MNIYNKNISIIEQNQNSKPPNFKKIDNLMSRSAQINKDNIEWLQKHNITDIINFRRVDESFPLDFDESQYAKSKNMVYHNIPSYTNYPEEKNLKHFLNIIEGIRQKGGKVHIHCREGADRTGMYAYIYERLVNLSSKTEAYKNFINGGWHKFDHPHLAEVAEHFVQKIKKARK